MRLADFSRTQKTVILVLMLVNFVNYVDRQIIFSLFPAIRHEFNLSFEQLSYLATAFTIVLSLASFPLGVLADRVSKRAVISAGVLFWSASTIFSGLGGIVPGFAGCPRHGRCRRGGLLSSWHCRN